VVDGILTNSNVIEVLPEAMASDLDIVLGTEVKEIQVQDQQVKVAITDSRKQNSTLEADIVICTLPLGVLKTK